MIKEAMIFSLRPKRFSRQLLVSMTVRLNILTEMVKLLIAYDQNFKIKDIVVLEWHSSLVIQ